VPWSGHEASYVQKHVDEFVRKFKVGQGVKKMVAVTTGHPSTEICKYAAEHDCDLIIMATHGRTGLAHMLLGSTTEQVVRHAPCPVLTLRIGPDRS